MSAFLPVVRPVEASFRLLRLAHGVLHSTLSNFCIMLRVLYGIFGWRSQGRENRKKSRARPWYHRPHHSFLPLRGSSPSPLHCANNLAAAQGPGCGHDLCCSPGIRGDILKRDSCLLYGPVYYTNLQMPTNSLV